MADARGGLGRRLLGRGAAAAAAAAGLPDAGAAAAAAILWGRLGLRKRPLHLLVNAAAAATFAVRGRRRMGFRLRSSRHRAGVSSPGSFCQQGEGGGGKGRRAGLAA